MIAEAAAARWHDVGAWVLIAANAAAGVVALAAHRCTAMRRRLTTLVIVAAQLTAVAQAISGSILIANHDRDPAPLHALYGFTAVATVGILYSYRTSSWMRGREYLLYALGSFWIMGLGLRELVLS